MAVDNGAACGGRPHLSPSLSPSRGHAIYEQAQARLQDKRVLPDVTSVLAMRVGLSGARAPAALRRT